MNLYESIKNYEPFNMQEMADKKQMLKIMESQEDIGRLLSREDGDVHFTVSIWTLDPTHAKTLMVYHNIYKSWSWIGGHADGEEDLRAVAMRELEEETGIKSAKVIDDEIFSLEILTASGHVKNGIWVPSHLHLNLTYLAEADDALPLYIKEDENAGVKWWLLDDVEKVSKERWMIDNIYRKLIAKTRG